MVEIGNWLTSLFHKCMSVHSRLTIVIPTLNEEHYVGVLLDCLLVQTVQDFEIVVVDAGSDDRTKEVVAEYLLRFGGRLRFVVPGGKGVSYQRNVGAALANTECLLFLDADVQVKPTFVDHALRELEKRCLALATCQFEPMTTRVDDKLLYLLASAYIATLQYLEPVSMGWCIFSTKTVHEEIGGFDEGMKFGEDYEYVQRAAKKNYKLKVLRSAKVYTSVRRLDDEGRLTYYKKAVLSEVYRFLNGKVENDMFDYEFGKFREDMSARKYNGEKEFWKRMVANVKESFKL